MNVRLNYDGFALRKNRRRLLNRRPAQAKSGWDALDAGVKSSSAGAGAGIGLDDTGFAAGFCTVIGGWGGMDVTGSVVTACTGAGMSTARSVAGVARAAGNASPLGSAGWAVPY